jgi:hypothetical protein
MFTYMPVVACECSRAAAMSSDKLAARKGRLRQRYDDDDHRLVAGSAPLSFSASRVRQ